MDLNQGRFEIKTNFTAITRFCNSPHTKHIDKKSGRYVMLLILFNVSIINPFLSSLIYPHKVISDKTRKIKWKVGSKYKRKSGQKVLLLKMFYGHWTICWPDLEILSLQSSPDHGKSHIKIYAHSIFPSRRC